jgi:two-component system, LuxR family, response regulator FixJ
MLVSANWGISVSMDRGKIFVVDDDESVRQATCWALNAAGYQAVAYESGEAFLRHADIQEPGCAVLDLNMPGMSGIDTLQRLRERGSPLSVVMLTGYGDVPTAVRAIQAGAMDFIEKPYDPEALLAAIGRALAPGGGSGEDSADMRADAARARIRHLSPRQCQVLQGLVAGLPNKVIAQDLGVSPRTIEMHRADMMDRLGVSNLSEALRLAYDAGLAPDRRAGGGARAGGRRATDPRPS